MALWCFMFLYLPIRCAKGGVVRASSILLEIQPEIASFNRSLSAVVFASLSAAAGYFPFISFACCFS